MVFDSASSKSLHVLDSFFKTAPSYAPYATSKSSVSHNMVTFITNSIRAELCTILKVLKTIAKRPHHLTRHITFTLYSWLQDSTNQCHTLFDILQTEIIDKVVKNGTSMGPLNARKRTLLIGSAQRSLQTLVETEKKISPHLPPGEAFGVLADSSGEIRTVFSVLSLVDEVLPESLHESFKGQMKKMERKFYSEILCIFGKGVLNGALTRWMDRKQFRYMAGRQSGLFGRGRLFKLRKRDIEKRSGFPMDIEGMLAEEEQMEVESMVFMNPSEQNKFRKMSKAILSRRSGEWVVEEVSSEEKDSIHTAYEL